MKIKNINISIRGSLIGLLLVVFTGCDLNRFPESDLSDAVFWQSENDFRQATAYLYAESMTDSWAEDVWQNYADRMSDNAVGHSFSDISNGSYLPGANFGPWNVNYRIIRAANKILEQADQSELDPTVLARFIAEAKFFRAYMYFELVKRYGDVPLVLQTLDINNDELYMSRTDREVVIDTAYQDLDYAATYLPLRSEMDLSIDYGRATQGTALAMKARVALFEGTRQKFHGTSGSHSSDYHLQIAKDAAFDVIEGGEFTLFDGFGIDSYRELFKAEGEGVTNMEAIWVYQYGVDELNDVNRTTHQLQLRQGEISATRSLVDAYLADDGLPIEVSPLYQGQTDASSEFIDRDPRLDGTIVRPGEFYWDRTTPHVPSLDAPSGYFVEKYYNFLEGALDLMRIRYAEVLLIYAEATYELDDAISDSDLNLSINLLRDRVGMPNLTNAFVTGNGLDMQEEIRRERRVELAMEGFRYFDLLRWKTAEIELPKAIMGVRFFNAEYPANQPEALNLTADSVVIVELASGRSFDPNKQYLWPIPLNQIALNPNIEQNPNWK